MGKLLSTWFGSFSHNRAILFFLPGVRQLGVVNPKCCFFFLLREINWRLCSRNCYKKKTSGGRTHLVPQQNPGQAHWKSLQIPFAQSPCGCTPVVLPHRSPSLAWPEARGFPRGGRVAGGCPVASVEGRVLRVCLAALVEWDYMAAWDWLEAAG